MGSLALLLAVLPSLLLTPPGASADPGCSLDLGGELHTSLVLTADQDILVAGRGCELTLLAVGGGGRGGLYGGAGSGHLEYRSLGVEAGTVISARVGGQGRASSLALSTGRGRPGIELSMIFSQISPEKAPSLSGQLSQLVS